MFQTPLKLTFEIRSAVRDGEQGEGSKRSHPGPHAGPPGPEGRPIVALNYLEVSPVADDVEKGLLFFIEADKKGVESYNAIELKRSGYRH